MKFASHLKQIRKRKANTSRDSLFGSPAYLYPRVSVDQPFNQARVQYERLRTEPIIDSRDQREYAAPGHPIGGLGAAT
jgi:hypothetical protein